MWDDVLDWFRQNQSGTADDCEAALNISHHSCSARITDLTVSGFLVRTEERKKTRSGKSAHVFRVNQDA